MTEAKDDSTQNPSKRTISVGEIHTLVERVAQRADAIENRGTADLVSDLRLLAKVVYGLLKYFQPSDAITIDNGA